MKRMFTASALVIALAAGSAAIAGPEHAEHKDKDQSKAKSYPTTPTLEQLFPDVKAPKTPDLWIGSDAPALQIAQYVKGESVDGFQNGQVYVVEFWATWCGPCIAAFPHLSEMQTQYGEKVTFMGVNVWEQSTGAERIQMINEFVSDQGDRMNYTVAVEVDGKMSETWLRPANQNGIPAAFIVDQKGKIAWVGHPMTMDEPLAEIVAGNYTAEDAKASALENELIKAAFMKFQELVQSGEDFPKMHDIAMALINNHFADEPGGLNAIAWMILTTDVEGMPKSEYMVAHQAAALACEATEWKDWSTLDTYAMACMKVGDPREAAKWQQKAIDLTPKSETKALSELKLRLAEYTEASEG